MSQTEDFGPVVFEDNDLILNSSLRISVDIKGFLFPCENTILSPITDKSINHVTFINNSLKQTESLWCSSANSELDMS